MGGYIVLIGAFILAVYIIFFFASKSVAKDKGVTTDAVTKQAALGDYNTEDNLPKEIVVT